MTSFEPTPATPPTPPSEAYCPSCAYDRAGLPDSAPCPECNAPAPPPGPRPEPGWLELLVRTIFRPRVLWTDLISSERNGSLLLSNMLAATALFISAALVLLGIRIFTDIWRGGGPHEAIPVLAAGVVVVLVITPIFTAGLGIPLVIAAVAVLPLVRSVAGLFVPVRSGQFVRSVAAYAAFPLVAWGIAAWGVVALSGAVTLLLLACGASPRLEAHFLSMAALTCLAIACAGVLHAIVLLIWGMRDPAPPSHGAGTVV